MILDGREKGEKMNKEKTFEMEIAKEFGQELVDKIKKLPDETVYTGNKYAKSYRNEQRLTV